MNIAILGTEQPSQIIAQIIEQHYNEWLEEQGVEKLNVVAFVTEETAAASNVGDIPVLNLVQFALLYHKKAIDKIIFPREVFFETQKICLTYFKIFNIKIEDIFIAARLNDLITAYNFLEPYMTSKYMPHIEFHIADHCNLNCKYCEHYSGLVKEPKFPVLEKFVQGFYQLKKFIDDFAAIRILGGEPLLNPEVNEYMKICRKIYPVSPIHLATNAILLPKMNDEFFDTVRENNVQIYISFYPPMQSKMPEIQRLLTEKKVQFTIGNLVKIFIKNQTLKPNNNPSEIFKRCGWARCHNFCDGKISACFKPFVVKYFNAYYNKNLPSDGTIDLYEEGLTTEKLKFRLNTPFNLCNYCRSALLSEWGVVKHPSPITDWIIEE